jgi:hypothetical protein
MHREAPEVARSSSPWQRSNCSLLAGSGNNARKQRVPVSVSLAGIRVTA